MQFCDNLFDLTNMTFGDKNNIKMFNSNQKAFTINSNCTIQFLEQFCHIAAHFL